MKFRQHYVEGPEGKRVKVSYRVEADQSVTIYARDYGHELDSLLPEATTNNTDLQTDYFEKSITKLKAGHPHYEEALATAQALEGRRKARYEAKEAARKLSVDKQAEAMRQAQAAAEPHGIFVNTSRARSRGCGMELTCSFHTKWWVVYLRAARWVEGHRVQFVVRDTERDQRKTRSKHQTITPPVGMTLQRAMAYVLEALEGKDLKADTPEGMQPPVLPKGLCLAMVMYYDA